MANKKLIIASAGVTTLALGGVVGLSTVSAASGTTGSLADKIAAALHVKSADVQKVIDQDRADHQADREKNYEDRLANAVTEGKITAAQKDLILAKHKELVSQMQAQRDADKDLTQEQREAKRADMKTKMEAQKTALDQWAKDNGLTTEQERLVMGGSGSPGFGLGKHMQTGGPVGDDAGAPPADGMPSTQ